MASQTIRATEETERIEARPSRMKWIERVRARKADSALSEADLEEEEMGRECVDEV